MLKTAQLLLLVPPTLFFYCSGNLIQDFTVDQKGSMKPVHWCCTPKMHLLEANFQEV